MITLPVQEPCPRAAPEPYPATPGVRIADYRAFLHGECSAVIGDMYKTQGRVIVHVVGAGRQRYIAAGVGEVYEGLTIEVPEPSPATNPPVFTGGGEVVARDNRR